MVPRNSLAVFGVILASLLALPSVNAEEENTYETETQATCEPVVVGVTVDWNTTPPTVTPFLMLRPECLLP